MVSINGHWLEVVIQKGRGLMRVGAGGLEPKAYSADIDRGTLEVFGTTERERICNAFYAGQDLRDAMESPAATDSNVVPLGPNPVCKFGPPPALANRVADRLREL